MTEVDEDDEDDVDKVRVAPVTTVVGETGVAYDSGSTAVGASAEDAETKESYKEF